MDLNQNIYPLKARRPDVLWDRALNRRPSLILDIGANDGGSCVSMASRAGRIDAFEPIPDVFAKLRAATRDITNIAIFNLGISDEISTIRGLNVFNAWTLLPSEATGERADGYGDAPAFDVEMTTIDAHSDLQGDPDFIKLDVDGYELRVLAGAIETLRRQPCPIFFEYSYLPARLLGDSAHDMCRIIYGLGYRAWSLDGEYCAESAGQMLKHYPKHTSYDLMLVHRDDPLIGL